MCWQLLLGYLPSNPEWRADTLQRKRREYWESVPQFFDAPDAERSQYQRDTLHQILMDVPRTSPSSRLLHHEVRYLVITSAAPRGPCSATRVVG